MLCVLSEGKCGLRRTFLFCLRRLFWGHAVRLSRARQRRLFRTSQGIHIIVSCPRLVAWRWCTKRCRFASVFAHPAVVWVSCGICSSSDDTGFDVLRHLQVAPFYQVYCRDDIVYNAIAYLCNARRYVVCRGLHRVVF